MSAHSEGLVHHMCYSSANLADSLKALDADGSLRVLMVSSPKEAVLFGGKRVSWYLVAGLGLIEIIDEALSDGGRAGGEG